MKKRILFGCIGSLLISQAVNATHGAFYFGANGSRNFWHVTQKMGMDASKVADPTPYNQDWGQTSKKMTAELVGGVKASNGTVFGAIEGWYNPSSISVNTTNNDITFNTTINNQWGARILAGVQHKEMTIYSILGLGKTKLTQNTSFPSGGVYDTLPGVSLLSTNGGSNEVTRTIGIGMSVIFTKDWDVNVEYQHISADNSTNLYDSIMTHLNIIGNQTTAITSDTLNIGLKYHFKPFTF